MAVAKPEVRESGGDKWFIESWCVCRLGGVIRWREQGKMKEAEESARQIEMS